MLNVMKISNYINSKYPNKTFAILDNGTIVFVEENNVANYREYIKNFMSTFVSGTLDFYYELDENKNMIVTYNNKNVLNILFPNEMKNKKYGKEFYAIQGRNCLIKDIYTPRIYAMFEGKNPIETFGLYR